MNRTFYSSNPLARGVMNLPVASMDPVFATFVLAVLVLIAGTVLAMAALKASNEKSSQQVFAAVGVLFGLLAAGGLGGLFVNQAAENAADKSATKAANQVSSQVSDEVETALQSPSQGSSNDSQNKGKGSTR